MSEDARTPTDAELEALLDEESDEEFGFPVIDDSSRAVLKEWSAQDFANIYTRFRPHLERHARRFLRNQSQVDEVVQDAFLYLMVTLPELDSELGVLRFLKWKTRLLSIDVIRASSRAQISDIDAHPEFESNDPEVSSALEQAEDAAIVRLALSKLNPRHREVLLASIYEEKTSAQIATQVGLSENATNQLIFRARAAFKKALLGDGVDTTGMSTAKILSVAARKAAADAKKVGAQAMVFVFFMILAAGSFVSFNRNFNQDQVVADGPKQLPTSSPSQSTAETSETGDQSGSPDKEPGATATPSSSASSQSFDLSAKLEASQSPAPTSTAEAFPQSELMKIANFAGNSELILSQPNLRAPGSIEQNRFVVADDAGIVADFVFNAEKTMPFSRVQVNVLGNKSEAMLYTDASRYSVVTDANGIDHYILMSYFSPTSIDTNFDGKAVNFTELFAVRIEVLMQADGSMSGAPTLKLVNLND